MRNLREDTHLRTDTDKRQQRSSEFPAAEGLDLQSDHRLGSREGIRHRLDQD